MPKSLVDFESHIWHQDEEIDIPLIQAASTGDIEKLKDFINSPGRDPAKQKEYLRNIRFDSDGMATFNYEKPKFTDGWCLLNAAAFGGQSEIIKMLVQQVGMRVNTICFGVTPIFCCLPSIHEEIGTYTNADNRLKALETFIDLRANTKHISDHGTSVVRSICNIPNEERKTEALRILVKKTPEAAFVADNRGFTVYSHLSRSPNWHKSKEKLSPEICEQLCLQLDLLYDNERLHSGPSQDDLWCESYNSAKFTDINDVEISLNEPWGVSYYLTKLKSARSKSLKNRESELTDASAGGTKPPVAEGGTKSPATKVTEALAKASITTNPKNKTP